MKKGIKYICTILVIFITIAVSTFTIGIPESYARLGTGARQESGHSPNPQPPSDTPSNPVQTQTTTDYNEYSTVVINTYIDGYVKIDTDQTTLDHYEGDADIAKNQSEFQSPKGASDNDDSRYKPAEGFCVQVITANGDVVAQKFADKDGHFHFDYTETGTGSFYLRFVMGDISVSSNTEDYANLLKYNGHDYIITKMPDGRYTLSTLKQEIIRSGKGAEQVFLAIDDSISARETEVKMKNGKSKTRLEVEVDAAKQMVSELLNSGENVYIGIVSFSGEAQRICSLTKSETLLTKTLDNLLTSVPWVDTDVMDGLNKVDESYVTSKNTNRTLIMISDGLPTADQEIDQYVYCDMSDDEAENLMRNVFAPRIKEKLNKLRNIDTDENKGKSNRQDSNDEKDKEDGVKVMSLIVRSDDEEEREYVDQLYKDNVDLYKVTDDGEDMADAIKGEVKSFILQNTNEKHYEENVEQITGLEDSARRAEIDNYFKDKTFTYKANSSDEMSVSLFKQTEEGNYNAEDAQKLSDLTKITGTSGSENGAYEIQPPTSKTTETEGPFTKELQENGESQTITYYKITTYVNTGYQDQTMYLGQRPALSLTTQVTATNLNITLASGQDLYNTSVAPGSKDIILAQMDNELVYGSTSNATYTLTVRNNSSIQCNYLELINYCPSGYSLNFDLTQKANQNMSDDYLKNILRWPDGGLKGLNQSGKVTDQTYNDIFGDRDCFVITLNNDGKGKDGFYIPPGGEWQIKLVFSKLLSDIDTASPETKNREQDISEIIAYKDSDNRRMAFIPTGLSIFKGVFPGSSSEQDYSEGTNSFEIMNPLGNSILNKIIIYGLNGLLIVAIVLFAGSLILLGTKKRRK